MEQTNGTIQTLVVLMLQISTMIFICNFMFRMRSSRVFKNIFSILSREMKLVSLLVLVLLSIQSSYGQQVSGVVQHDNNAIEYCNVMVKNVEDSAFVSRNSNRPH